MENNAPILDADIAYQIAEFERQMKTIEEHQKRLKSAVLEAMEAKGIIKIDTDDLTITYVAPTDREKFDSKQFRSDHSELYDEYVSMIPVKSSIRIKVK
jgi:hypothetical protein